MMKHGCRLSFLFILLVLASFVSCKKEPHVIQGKTIADSAILLKIPQSSVAVFTGTSKSQGFKKFKQSPLYQGSESFAQMLNTIKNATPKDMPTGSLINVLEAINESQFFDSGADNEMKFDDYALFLSEENGHPVFGIYFTGEKDLESQAQIFAEHLNKKKVLTQPDSFKNVSGFFAKNDSDLSSAIPGIYFAGKGKILAMASTKSLVEQSFDEKPADSFDAIKKSQGFVEVTKKLTFSDNDFGFAFIDFPKLWKVLPGLSDLSEEMSKFPLSSASVLYSYEDTLTSKILASINPKDDKQAQYISLLKGSELSILNKLPRNLLALFTLGGNIFEVINTIPKLKAEIAKYATYFDLVKGIKELSIGLKKSEAGSPFPELLIASLSDNPKVLLETLKANITSLLSSFGMGGINWVDKDLDEAKVSFIPLPLPVAIYAANIKDMVVLTSSEQSMVDILKTSKDGKNSMAADPFIKKTLNADNNFAFSFMDFEKIAIIAKNLQSSFGAMAGSQEAMSQFDSFQKVGSTAIGIRYETPLLSLSARYSPPLEIKTVDKRS